jgi:hypothetical protein
VGEEREIAINTIQAWNDLNSSERQIVLLPLRWETHAAPEYGHRPQGVINRQVVDHCDLLVGIFWTRIGSPTGVAESGTIEEIERVAKQGKPVMLYFSQSKQSPDDIDLEQLKRLRDFKGKTFPNALVEHFTNQIDFRDKLSRQLEIQLRTLLAEENKTGDTSSNSKTEIEFGFADVKTGTLIGSSIDLQSTLIRLERIDELPDYLSRPPIAASGGLLGDFKLFNDDNKDYYRDMAKHLVAESFYRPVRFWLKNVGGVGARDIYVDIRISSNDSKIVARPCSDLEVPVQKNGARIFSAYHLSASAKIEDLGNEKVVKLELPALQPQRAISPTPEVMIGANQSGIVVVEARIYADSLPEPVLKILKIDWTINDVRMNARDLLKTADVSIVEPHPREAAKDG